MLLTEGEVRRSLTCVKAAFPHFANGEHANQLDEAHSGFALWGQFVPELEEPMPRRFFITFDAYEATWRGHLTIGQHCYYWSSADFGDAHLLDTSPCATLEEAITMLRVQIAHLFTALSGPAAEPGAEPVRDRT